MHHFEFSSFAKQQNPFIRSQSVDPICQRAISMKNVRMAPYRHFADREELLAAVAAQGFRELDEVMLKAVRHQRSSVARLKRAGLAYVEFALRRPEHFTVMFDAAVSEHKTPASAQAAEQAFGTLLGLVKSCQEEGRLPSGDIHQLALLAWSMVHGVAKLATAKRLPWETTADVLKFANFVINESLPVKSGKRSE